MRKHATRETRHSQCHKSISKTSQSRKFIGHPQHYRQNNTGSCHLIQRSSNDASFICNNRKNTSAQLHKKPSPHNEHTPENPDQVPHRTEHTKVRSQGEAFPPHPPPRRPSNYGPSPISMRSRTHTPISTNSRNCSPPPELTIDELRQAGLSDTQEDAAPTPQPVALNTEESITEGENSEAVIIDDDREIQKEIVTVNEKKKYEGKALRAFGSSTSTQA